MCEGDGGRPGGLLGDVDTPAEEDPVLLDTDDDTDADVDVDVEDDVVVGCGEATEEDLT